jgi:small multidrug resistance pump
MSWVYLITAVLFDVAGTVSLKLSYGCSRAIPTIFMLVLYSISVGVLALAMRQMPVSIVYAVWSALGTALVVTIGIVFFKEPANAMKLVSLMLIVVGLVVLNLSAGRR